MSDESQVAESTPQSESNLNEAQPVNFLDNISEDLRGDASLKDFKDVNGLAKSYINAQKMIGNSIRLPSEDSSPEAKQDFLDKLKGIDNVIIKPSGEEGLEDYYNKLGRPESSDKYTLKELVTEDLQASLPDISLDVENFQQEAFELGLTNEQASKLIDNRLKQAKDSIESQNLAKEESIKQLQKLWGQDYDNRMASAKQTAKVYADKFPNEMESLINSNAGNNPAFLNMLVELGANLKEKGHAGMQQAKFGMTPEGAKAKIAELRSDRGFMKDYTDSLSSNHQGAVNKLAKLYEIANQ